METCIPIRLPPKDLDWRKLTPSLGEARESLARYDEILRFTSPSLLEIFKWTDAISTIRSQKIYANLQEVLQFALENKATEKRAPLLQKIVNAKEGLDFSIRWVEKQKPLTLSFLCQLHAILKKDASNPKEIGRFRQKQNWIGLPGGPIEKAYFFPPKASLIPKYLKDWLRYSSYKKEEPLIQLAILFAQFLIIHPFMDGNGRVARDYIPLFLYKKKLLSKPFLFLSEYFEDHRLSYIEHLFHISAQKNWEDWVLYFLKGILFCSRRMRIQVSRLHVEYVKIRKEEPFFSPLALNKKKWFTRNSRGMFIFAPLFQALRYSRFH